MCGARPCAARLASVRREGRVLRAVRYGGGMISPALLIARIGLGIIFVAHGWQKFHDLGVDAVGQGFSKMGVPAPEISAYFATFVELVGGVALILGLFTGLAALLLTLDMLGALVFVHLKNGVFITENGWELVVALGIGTMLLAVLGAGAYSIDNSAAGRRFGRRGAFAPGRRFAWTRGLGRT